MGDVLELPERGQRPNTAPFDLVAAKLRPPQPRPGTVHRAVLGRLTEEHAPPVVSVVAPAGYGKTTLLVEWAQHDDRPFAWVSVDEHDNDPKVLLAYVAEALDRVEPINGRVFDALASPVSSVAGSVVPRLASAFADMRTPVVLVLDDVHLVHNRECRSALSVLADHVPDGSRLALAGRESPPVRIARLRTEGRVTEVGVPELSMTSLEAGALLRAAEVELDDADVRELHQRTEGWPVGLYLAALYVREGGSVGDAAAGSFRGDDRLVTQYLESELLDRVSRRHREFLTRSAALTSMSAALCEATLGLAGTAATLTELARSNTLLVPLDRRGEWYRYHHLFGDMLRTELERREPGVVTDVRRRASAWYLAHDRPEEAVEYAIAAQDIEAAASLVERFGFAIYWHGRRDRLDAWTHWLDQRDAVRTRPMIAVIAGFLCMSTLRVPEAAQWADLLDQWQYAETGWAGDRATEAFAAMLRASVCRGGAEGMRADVDEAAAKFAEEGIETPNLVVYQALVSVIMGDVATGDALFQEVVSQSEGADMQEILACALYERALVAMAQGQWAAAHDFADQLVEAVAKPGGSEEVFVWIVRARVAAHDRDLATARDALARTQTLRALMPMPVFAVQNRIELARAYLALDDLNGARTVMGEAEEILQRHPDLGALGREARALSSRLAEGGRSPAGPSALTAAELRLLPMLTSHLTYREIADELVVSQHTVHAQVRSIFGKVGATTRSEAVRRCRELELLE